MSAQHLPPQGQSQAPEPLLQRESESHGRRARCPELRRCPWSWSDAGQWGFAPPGPRPPLGVLVWYVSPWIVGLPLEWGAPPTWASPWRVSLRRVGLPLEGGSPPGGWVSPSGSPSGGWVSPGGSPSRGWVSPWWVSVAAQLRTGQARMQTLGAQPGKDFLWGLGGSHRPRSNSSTGAGREGDAGSKMFSLCDSSCGTFFRNKQFQWAQWTPSHTANTAVWGQRPWVFCGYRRPAGWATRPLVGGTLLYSQT